MNGLFLLGHVDDTATAFANLLKQLVMANPVTGVVAGRWGWGSENKLYGSRRFGRLLFQQSQFQQTLNAKTARRIGRQFGSATGAMF
jgi:hypothetical protein